MLDWKPVKKHDLPGIVDSWTSQQSIQLNVSAEFESVRAELLNHHKQILQELEIQNVKGKEYSYDLRFAQKLYSYLKIQLRATESLASNDSFWVFLGIRIIPDIVFWRWGPQAHARFYASSRRIWLKALWWYFHLSWQGGVEETRKILEGNTTDDIVQLVERSGPQGYRVDLCREIMRFYGTQGNELKGRGNKLFRRAMKLNTARLAVVEPALYDGAEEGYVKELFYELIAN